MPNPADLHVLGCLSQWAKLDWSALKCAFWNVHSIISDTCTVIMRNQSLQASLSEKMREKKSSNTAYRCSAHLHNGKSSLHSHHAENNGVLLKIIPTFQVSIWKVNPPASTDEWLTTVLWGKTRQNSEIFIKITQENTQKHAHTHTSLLAEGEEDNLTTVAKWCKSTLSMLPPPLRASPKKLGLQQQRNRWCHTLTYSIKELICFTDSSKAKIKPVNEAHGFWTEKRNENQI